MPCACTIHAQFFVKNLIHLYKNLYILRDIKRPKALDLLEKSPTFGLFIDKLITGIEHIILDSTSLDFIGFP